MESKTAAGTENKPTLAAQIFSKNMGICLITGFSSGLPLFVLLNLMSAWLRKEGIDLKIIGIMSLIMIPYTWKFLWAPVLDRFTLFNLGRRRGWMLATQLVLIVLISALGFLKPQYSMGLVSLGALLVAFASASQDIVIDAYRREILSDNELGLGNSLFVNAYRISSLVPGGLSLILADIMPWHAVFTITGCALVPGFILSIFLKEPKVAHKPRTLKQAVVEPFSEFIKRRGIAAALLTVAFVFLYKIGDSMATALATPFYMDMGFNLTTIGIVAKNAGLWSMVAGGLLGGVIMLKIGINKALWLFGIAQMVTILGFVWLAHAGSEGRAGVWLLALVIGAEALGTGLGTAAFVSFIARETNPSYTATQFALLTSFSAVPRTFCNAATGFLVESLGWESFFILCTLLAVPGMLLLFKVAPWNGNGAVFE